MVYLLKEKREEKLLSQSQLSRLSGVSRPTIIGIERNSNDGVRFTTLQKLATALECDVKDIIIF